MRVEHEPIWVPADLRINSQGDTRPGFICVHQLENGMGTCGGNVFSLDQAIGNHACWVPERFDSIRELWWTLKNYIRYYLWRG